MEIKANQNNQPVTGPLDHVKEDISVLDPENDLENLQELVRQSEEKEKC